MNLISFRSTHSQGSERFRSEVEVRLRASERESQKISDDDSTRSLRHAERNKECICEMFDNIF